MYTIVQQPTIQTSLPLQTQSLDSAHSHSSWPITSSHLVPEKTSSRRASLVSSGTYTQIVSAANAQASKSTRKTLDIGSSRPLVKDFTQRLESIDEATPRKEKEWSSPPQPPLRAIDIDFDNSEQFHPQISPRVQNEEHRSVLRSISADSANRKAQTTTTTTAAAATPASSPKGRRPTIISGNIASKRSSISGNTSFLQQQPAVKRKRVEMHDSPSSKENFIDHVVFSGSVPSLSLTTNTSSALNLGAARRLEKVSTQLSASMDQMPTSYLSSRRSKAVWRQ